MRKMETQTLIVLGLLSATAVFGCGEVTEPPDPPDVTGTYEGFFHGAGFQVGGGDAGGSGECDVTIELVSQSGVDVSGSFQLGDQCGGRSGDVKGVLCEEDPQAFGCSEDVAAINLDFNSEGDNLLELLTGCSISSGDGSFQGVVRGGGALDVASRIMAACPDDNGGTVTVEWVFQIQAGQTT